MIPTKHEDTRNTIIVSSLKLFSENGIEGVSLTQVRKEANQHNRSVIYYYFSSKEGLLEAVTGYVWNSVYPEFEKSSQIVKALKINNTNTQESIKVIIEALIDPFFNIYFEHTEGEKSIRYLLFLMQSNSALYQRIAKEFVDNITNIYVPLLKKLCHKKVTQDIGLLVYFLVTNTLNMLANMGKLSKVNKSKSKKSEAFSAATQEIKRFVLNYQMGAVEHLIT